MLATISQQQRDAADRDRIAARWFWTSSCVCENSVPTPNAPAMPSVRPIASCMNDRRRNSHATSLPCAPSAMRTPISCVRCDTA